MTKVLQRVEVSLRSFYIFNSQFGKKEGEEHKKVLYYHPDDIELNTKIKDVGLSEAIIAFTGTFNVDNCCKALHTQKTTQLFYQPEPDYWMVLVINLPKEIRSKDGIEVAEYRAGEVHDDVYRGVLEKAYNMFRLFTGTFQFNYTATGSEEQNGVRSEDAVHKLMCNRLRPFFDKYLHSLKLSACDVMDAIRSIQYLPLDKFLFLRAHNFINMICATFPAVTDAVFLYNEQVVCSGKLQPNDLYSLHEHIVGTVIPRVTQTELGSATGLTQNNNAVSEMFRNGTFLNGCWDDQLQQQDESKATKVYLSMGQGQTTETYYLVIYRALDVTLCLFLNDCEEPEQDIYTELHLYMGPQLISIARDIGNTIAKQTGSGKQTISASAATACVSSSGLDTTDSSSMTPKYLFINEQSLKHLSNINIDHSRPKVTHSIPSNVMNVIADLGNELQCTQAIGSASTPSPPAFEEVQVKTTNDFWIVKRRCNWRQYYVVIFNSKATLLDVTHEAKRVFDQELTDDVFFDK